MKPRRSVMRNHHLGIDLGTTSVKAVIWDAENQHCECEAVETTNAGIAGLPNGRDEQDVKAILGAVQRCVQRLPSVKLRSVESIGISGQMHGVVMWKSDGVASYDEDGGVYSVVDPNVSSLVTWQDGRCTSDFLASLPPPESHIKLSSGFGCATLFWLSRNSPQTLDHYDSSGTIGDFLVALICGLQKPVMTTQNAAAWGYFDTVSKKWNTDLLKEAGFPVHLLPEVEAPRYKPGRMKHGWCGVPAGTVVGAAFGDMQCSVHSVLSTSPAGAKHAVLNISTSAQLSFVMDTGFNPKKAASDDPTSPLQFWPYFDGTYLAIAATLNGGNVLARWISMFSQVFRLLGQECPEEELWSRLLQAAASDSAMNNLAVVDPLLYGERHNPTARGSITNIGPEGLNAPSLTRAICRGIIENIRSIMPPSFLRASSVVNILGTGSALTRNVALQKEVVVQYEMPFVMRQCGDAAVGAAKGISQHP